MSKRTKTWLIAATALVVIGLLMFTIVMSVYRWNFTKLSTVNYETNTYEISEEFSDISIKTEITDIFFVPSDDGTCRVVCYETENEKHSVDVQGGTLTIDAVSRRKWYRHIGIMIEDPRITVYLPESEYASLSIKESIGDVEIPKEFKFKDIDISSSTGSVKSFASASELIKIETSTGDIRVEDASADTLDLSVTTGKVTVSDITCEGDIKINVSTGKTNIESVRCKNVISDGSTGGISLKDVIATEKFFIERSTGDVKLDGCDAAEIFIETDTGDVTGSLLTGKAFITQSRLGSIDVPDTATGGKCEIRTSMGDIRFDIR